MYLTTDTWKEAMSRPARPKGYARVAFGLIDLEAQPDASVTLPNGTYYAIPSNVNTDWQPTSTYGSFESGGMKLNRPQRIIPADSGFTQKQGWASADIADENGLFTAPMEITISFSTKRTFVGLTLSFDELREWSPKEMTFLSYRDNVLVSEQSFTNLDPLAKVQLLLEDINKVVVRFDKVGEYERARLNYIMYGIGYVYTNHDIINISEKHKKPIGALAVPQHDISIELTNASGEFNIGSDTALERFLKEGQEITVMYGLQTSAGIEWVPSYVWYLKTWKTEESKVTLNGVDIYALATETTYEKGVYEHRYYHTNEVFAAILSDAGINRYTLPTNYTGDSSGTSMPPPIVSHASALQLTANMALCEMKQTRDGYMQIEAAPEAVPDTLDIFRELAFFSTDVNSAGNKTEYGTFENKGMRLDGSQKIIPSNGQFEPTEYVSRNITDINGKTYEFTYLSMYYTDVKPTAYGVQFNFGQSFPRRIDVQHHDGEKWSKAKAFYPDAETFSVDYYAERVGAIQVTFQQTKNGYQRFRLNDAAPALWPKFKLPLEDCIGKPKGEILEKVKRVDIPWSHTFTVTNYQYELSRHTIPTNTRIRLEHDLAWNLEVRLTDISVTKIEQEHYGRVSYIKLVATAAKDVEVELWGAEISDRTATYAVTIADEGSVITIENPLYTRSGNAELCGQWFGDMYARRIKYTAKTYGFPELDCGDKIELWDGTFGTLIEHDFNFKGGAFAGQEVILKE